jgi:outer membrane protein assembly factor BamB
VMTAYDARTFTQKNVVGVSAETGSLLWRRPYTTPSTTTSQTPILYKDMVIEMGRNNGVTAFRTVPRGGQWTTEDVWHTDEVSMHMSDAVAIDGVLFGLSHLNSGQYFALDLETGRVLWRATRARRLMPPSRGQATRSSPCKTTASSWSSVTTERASSRSSATS